jgi:hypothetical protein
MRVLLHGPDDRPEAASRERRLQLLRGGQADAPVALGPAPLPRPLAEIAAFEYGRRGIRANAIAAGWREHKQ